MLEEAELTYEEHVNTRDILEQRGSRYGSFETHAEITQELKAIILKSEKISADPVLREALEMIMHKVGRIVNGDPYYDDSWVDIGGYAQLVVDYIKTGNKDRK